LSTTAIHRRVAALREGREPTCIARLASGWAVLGDPQVLRGCCLLLPDPVVGDLGDLTGVARTRFLEDMARLGDVVRTVTGAKRINYAMLGNQEPALHAHVFPRFADEPEQTRTSHPWAYDWSAAPRFDATRDAALIESLRRALESA
jgi:diadenosine tetraphosphate (Ap4A) HIT family hydrolase